MISSEVQRTLVKSPPELWAELSDPGSLARHLGDLGEIRITRVEPEQLVEWEAENRTGKVQIKASAWGTRVTLTVASEIPEATTPPDTPPPAAEPEDAADPISADASPGEAEPAHPTDGLPSFQDAAEAAAEAPAAAAWQEEPEPAGEIVSDPAWPPESDPSFVSAAMASAEGEHEPPGDFDAEPTEAEIELDAAEAERVSDEPYTWPADEEPQPRRGFFARLFGRRPRPSAPEPDPAEAINPTWSSEQPAELAPDDAAPEVVEAAADPQTPETPEAAPETPEAAPEAPEAAVEAVEAEPETPAAAGDEAPIAQTEERAEEAALHTQAAEQAEGISAELKAAEEITDAQVTAVLTSALDRLGAAHHRPFSRS